MKYVDGYVLVVSKKKLKAYLKMAKLGEKVWRKHGALDYKECVGDDLNTKWGTTFPKVMKLKPGETVVFSYIVFKSRAHRDRVNAKVMKDNEQHGRADGDAVRHEAHVLWRLQGVGRRLTAAAAPTSEVPFGWIVEWWWEITMSST